MHPLRARACRLRLRSNLVTGIWHLRPAHCRRCSRWPSSAWFWQRTV